MWIITFGANQLISRRKLEYWLKSWNFSKSVHHFSIKLAQSPNHIVLQCKEIRQKYLHTILWIIDFCEHNWVGIWRSAIQMDRYVGFIQFFIPFQTIITEKLFFHRHRSTTNLHISEKYSLRSLHFWCLFGETVSLTLPKLRITCIELVDLNKNDFKSIYEFECTQVTCSHTNNVVVNWNKVKIKSFKRFWKHTFDRLKKYFVCVMLDVFKLHQKIVYIPYLCP